MKAAPHSLSARRIVRAAGDAAERWQNADFPARVRATRDVVRRTGYTEPVVEYALDALFGELHARALEGAIAGELGALEALDGFVTRTGRPDVTFAPRGAVTIVASSTTIGVAIPALCFALCAKARVHVKDRSDALVRSFVATLAEEEPALGAACDVAQWNGADAAAGAVHVARADVVVAYGADATLAAIRAEMAPLASLVAFGARTSVAYVARDDLRDAGCVRAAAAGIACDALLYDGEGCLSVHVVAVERGAAVSVPAFARELAAACDVAAIEFPAGYDALDADAAALRRSAAFRAAQGAGAVYGGTTAPHLVILDPPRDEPPPWARRTLAVYAVDGPHDAAAVLDGIALEAVAAGDTARDDVVRFARMTGASRIARFGTLQRPPLGGEHGGYGRILPFVRAIYRERC